MSRALLLALAATLACSSKPGTATAPGQHFCCAKVDAQFWIGQDCTPVDAADVAACTEALYCTGDWLRATDTGQFARPGVTTRCRGEEP